MSFRCDKCGAADPDRPTRVVIKTRQQQYHLPFNAGLALGWEIAAEVNLCPSCVKQHEPPIVDIGEANPGEQHAPS